MFFLNNYIININYTNRLLEIADEPFEKGRSIVLMHKESMEILTIPMSIDGKVFNFAFVYAQFVSRLSMQKNL